MYIMVRSNDLSVFASVCMMVVWGLWTIFLIVGKINNYSRHYLHTERAHTHREKYIEGSVG